MSKLTNINANLSFESDSGAGDGSTVNVDTSQPLLNDKLVFVFLNGIGQILNVHYTVNISLNRVTFATAPLLGQVINIKYAVKS